MEKLTLDDVAVDASLQEELSPQEVQAFKEFKLRAGEQKCQGRSDRFLLAFLLARKLNVERTLELYDKHLEWRAKYNVENPDLDRIRDFLAQGWTIWLPDKSDKEGRGVAFLFPHLMNFDTFDMELNFQTTAWQLDQLCERVDNTRKGFVFVEDLGGMSLGAFGKMRKIDTQEMMTNMQERLPFRIQKIYLLNPPWYLKLMLALVRPFMKKKLRNRVEVVTQEQLLEKVGHENVLASLGGNLDLDFHGWLDEAIEASKQARAQRQQQSE